VRKRYEPDINEAYKSLVLNEDFYLILRGGAGTGKSVFLSQKALLRLVSTPNMRGYGIRKVGKDIENSIFKEFLTRIREWGQERAWKWNKTKHSFENTLNGSELITLHMEDETRTKSIVEADFIWVEEMDQLTAEDWDQLGLRLRGPTDTYKQIMGSFNPTDEDSWIRSRFFPGEYEGKNRFRLEFSEADPLTGEEVKLHATVLQTTWRDNKFLTPQDRARYEALKHTNPNKYKVYVLNQWGRAEIELPWLHNFGDQHISDEAKYRPGQPVIISFDFNVDPMTATLHHAWWDKDGHHWHTFDEISIPNGSVPVIIERIKQTLPDAALASCLITGDATASKKDINRMDHRSSWVLIKQGLRVPDSRFRVPRSNPSLKDNRELCNHILYAHPDVKINPKCKTLVYECRYTEGDKEGGIPKKSRAKLEQRADALDTWRYVANSFLRDFADKVAKYAGK
jgi:hypothetical protein